MNEIITTTTEETATTPPGYATTEFWITLVSTIVPNLITILAIFKLVPNEVASTLSAALVAVIGGIITVFVTLRYIKSRTEVKMRSLDLQANLKYYRKDVEKEKAQLYLQLLNQGVVDKNRVRKELNIG